MKFFTRRHFPAAAFILGLLALAVTACSGTPWTGQSELTPADGKLTIPLSEISDGTAHHYQARANDGTMVHFFTLMSSDGVIRAAIDSCDVCYQSGLGYYQEGAYMVCKNCGQKFVSNMINVIKGGCNPAPLKRRITDDNLEIAMSDINANSWYMKYRQEG